jgi:hypothetical protein
MRKVVEDLGWRYVNAINVETINANNKTMPKKISVKLNATKEQIQHMEQLKDGKKLYNTQGQPLPYSKLGKYLIDNFGEQLSNAIRKYKLDAKRKQ